MRLAQRQIWFVMANCSYCLERIARKQKCQEIKESHGGYAQNGQARHQGVEAGVRVIIVQHRFRPCRLKARALAGGRSSQETHRGPFSCLHSSKEAVMSQGTK